MAKLLGEVATKKNVAMLTQNPEMAIYSSNGIKIKRKSLQENQKFVSS